MIILREQQIFFREVFQYFDSKNKLIKDSPDIVNQLNLYKGKTGLLRVYSKMERMKGKIRYNFPLHLSKKSRLTELIILNYHEKLAHSGCYAILTSCAPE